MVSPVLCGVVIVLILIKAYKYLFERPPNFPPGPPKIPIFGSYLFMLMINKDHLHRAAIKLSEYYKSKIIGLHLTTIPTIIVNDYNLAKEVLNRKDFDGRPDIYMARLRDPGHELRGIFFTDGPEWLEQRRYTLRYLRDFGFGRRFFDFEVEARSEIEGFIDMLKCGPKFEHESEFMKDGCVMCPHIFMACFGNAFLQILTGERIPRAEQKDIFETGKNAMIFQRRGDDYGTILSMWPFSRFTPFGYQKHKDLLEGNEGVYKFIKKIIDHHIATHDEGHTRNFLDMYITEMKNDPASTFQYDQLVLACVDFFFPSISGATTQLALLFLKLLEHPEIVRKIQKEIDENVGEGQLPSLDDRINLPYTEATMREGMRTETLVPSGIAHRALLDTTLGGFDIPKGTFVFNTITYIHNQKDIWGDPENFRPERFLAANGKLDLGKDKSLPFGAGRRLCAGETFARNTMFLIVAAIFQSFNLKQHPTEKIPDVNNPDTGIIISPKNFWIKFEAR